MPGSRRPDLKAEAIKLRLTERLGRNEISRRLGGQVNDATVGRWLRSCPLSAQEIRVVYDNNRKRGAGGPQKRTARSSRKVLTCGICGEPRTRKSTQYCKQCSKERRRVPTESWLQCGTDISSSRLKARLLIEGRLQEMCAICGLSSKWNDKPLVLQLDHINGVRTDNRLENLRIICPNCHSQTETYVGRNRTNPDRVSGHYVTKLRQASG